jgi:hypothetical protein
MKKYIRNIIILVCIFGILTFITNDAREGYRNKGIRKMINSHCMNKVMKNKCPSVDNTPDSIFEDGDDNNISSDPRYILKTQIVPPVCPKCPDMICNMPESTPPSNNPVEQMPTNQFPQNGTTLRPSLAPQTTSQSRETDAFVKNNSLPRPLIADFSRF